MLRIGWKTRVHFIITTINYDSLQNLDELVGLQEHQVKLVSHEKWNNIGVVLGTMEKTKEANEDVLVDALQSKYDSLQDKLILEALEKQMGTEKWEKLSDDEKQASLMKIKMEIKRLQDEGKPLLLFV